MAQAQRNFERHHLIDILFEHHLSGIRRFLKAQGYPSRGKKFELRVRLEKLLDQEKIDFAKRYFGVASEQEAIDRALSLLMEEQHILAALKPLKGSLKGDGRAWPYL